MKRLLYVFILAVAFASCENDFEDKFGATPTERTAKAIGDLTKLLTSSENGWKTTLLFRGEVLSAGDFFVMKFAPIVGGNSGQVAVANGFNSETSEFNIYHATGVVLNFNTSNKVFHWLVKPYNYQGLGTGAGANMEYIFMKEENGKLYFKGKTNGTDMILEKATAQDWDMTDIKANFANLQAVMARNFTTITVTKGLGATAEKPLIVQFGNEYITGDNSALPEKKGLIYRLYYDNNGDPVEGVQGSFVFTHNELILAEPIIVGTDTLSRFVYNKVSNRFEATKPGIEGAILGYDLPPFPSPGAFDKFVEKLESRWWGWMFWSSEPDLGKIGEYLKEVSDNIPELQYLTLTMHQEIGGVDRGCGFTFAGDWTENGTPYGFIPVKFVKRGESEMLIERNGASISNIPGFEAMITDNPHLAKLMNAFLNPKGWSIYMQQTTPTTTVFKLYDIEDPSIHMRKVF